MITRLVIHWSATDWGNAALITNLHRSNGWSPTFCPGYHEVILNGKLGPDSPYMAEYDGYVETGQPLDKNNMLSADEMGAHTLGLNESAIAFCVIGSPTSQPTKSQLYTLKNRIIRAQGFITSLEIGPHSAYNATECPGDVIRKFLVTEGYWKG